MDWLGKLLDIGLGGLPSSLVSIIPEDAKRRARARLEAHNPFSQISVNHDLLRAARLAWFEAAEKIVRAATDMARQAEWKRDATDIESVAKLALTQIATARDIALDRMRDPGTSPIDRHIEAVIRGVPEFVAPGNSRTLEKAVSEAFVEVLASFTGWPRAEIPPVFGQLAQEGLPVRGGANRAFGELMFAAFAELIKNPQRYPEAQAAFSLVQNQRILDATDATKNIAAAVFEALGSLDATLAETLGRRDPFDMLRAGAEAYLELLPEIAETVARIEQGMDRVEDKVDAQTAMLQELLARSAPGLPLATAKAILAAFGEELLPETEADIERILHAKADEFTALTERLREMDNSGDAVLRDLLREAEALIGQGDFDGAEVRLIEAENHADLARARIRANRGDLAKLRLRYKEAAEHFARAADIVPDAENVQRWDYLMQNADAFWHQGEEFGDNDALRSSIVLYEEIILPLVDRASYPREWAMTQYKLGNTLGKLGGRETEKERLEQAITAYTAALEVLTRDRAPRDWAAIQSNLGNVFWSMGERESGTEWFEHAIEAYSVALEEQSRESAPFGWASTQNNLGGVLHAWSARECGTARLEQAIKAYSAALEEYTRARSPLQWAMTQNNLGLVLAMLGEREKGTERLEQAIKAYGAALEERRRERVPLDWAATQDSMGGALWKLGERTNDTVLLDQAIRSFREALKERTRERDPLQWAMTQNNLGNALQVLGRAESDPERLQQAVDAYREALIELTEEQVPLGWALARANMAEALVALFDETGDPALLETANAHLVSVRAFFLEAGACAYLEYAEGVFAAAQNRLE